MHKPLDDIRKLLPKLTDAERALLYDQLGAKLNDPYARRVTAAAAADYNKLAKKMDDRSLLSDGHFNGPLREFAHAGPEMERNPIEHPELAYRRGYQQGAVHVVAVLEKADALPPGLLAVLATYRTAVANWRYPSGNRRRLRRHIGKDAAPELSLDHIRNVMRRNNARTRPPSATTAVLLPER
jgi:hypothetical protein